ncbi:MAG: class I SAM-dependent methyltransferase [Anaerolineae bacterium]|nr:class I SAM-dependent methyltransferase [Anaerolineae bacterium]MCA9908898.1 class I SAM-dependent methyltransferase [Anaerolineae bacterium]
MDHIQHIHLGAIYDKRFGKEESLPRTQLWQVLCDHWFQRYITPDDTVLDLAAGRCEFINQIHCGRKIAVDLNEDVKRFAARDVETVIAWSHDMQGVTSESVDVVFVSNFFEHLPDKQAFLDTLTEIKRVLRKGGRLLILQPNIRFLHGEYWDFIDHYLPLTDRSLVEALGLVGMAPVEVKPRFLPYTTRSRLPQAAWLVRLYLMLPLAHVLLGKQAWVVARKVTS